MEGDNRKEGEGKSKGARREDSWAWTMWAVDCGSVGGGTGKSNGGRGGTTVTEQQ